MGQPREAGFKIPFVNRPEFTIYIEYIPSQAGREYWLHCDVHRWTPRVAHEIDECLSQLSLLIDAPLFALVNYHNAKLAKFCEFFGMVETSVAEDSRGHLKKQYVAYTDRERYTRGS